MKRWLTGLLGLLLAVLFVFSGCQEAPMEELTTVQTEPTTVPTTAPPEPSFYVPDSLLERQTQGAVQLFLPETGNLVHYEFIGNDLLMLTEKAGYDEMTAWRVSCEDGTLLAKMQLPGNLQYWDGRMVCDENRITAYDMDSEGILIMDGRFRELDRVEIPDEIVGSVIISRDQETVYYSTGSEIRALELATGIPRVLLQQSGSEIFLQKLLFDESMLHCYVYSDAFSCDEFISTENGRSLGWDVSMGEIDAGESRYMIRRYDGPATELLIGRLGEDTIRSFNQVDPDSFIYLMPEIDSLAEISVEETGTRLNLFELERGTRTATLMLEDCFDIYNPQADPSGRYIWFFMSDYEQGMELLYRWDLSKTPDTDETTRLSKRFTAGDPDLEGIARCRERAEILEDTYGVEIYLYDEPMSPFDYNFEWEYQVPAIENSLDSLETALSNFPYGFMRTTASVTESGRLHIGIVRSMYGVEYNTVSDAVALQYWIDGDAYIALCSSDALEENFYHELCHAMDTYIYNESAHYDYWEAQNPGGFEYDYSYTDYWQHEDSPYLEPENRAFIDAYSMTYPHEDRARVMEYAMMEGNEDYFSSAVMQAKLKLLCKAIRDAYGWKRYEGTFLWEQYLQESLAYVKKK